MTTKIALLATVGLIATASLIVGLQQVYVSQHQAPAPIADSDQTSIVKPVGEVAGETTATPVSNTNEIIVQPLPTVNATKGTPGQPGTAPAAALQLCAQHQGSLLWACSGRGVNYYAVTANQMIVDAPMDVYASDGSFIVSCGGYQVFTSEAAQAASQQQCSQYHLNDCQEITSLCAVR